MRPTAWTTDSSATTGGTLTSPSGILWRDIVIVVAVAWAARLLFLWLIPTGACSFDAYCWQHQAYLLKNGVNPYQANYIFNWPPFWMQCVYVISKIADRLDVSFFRVLQIVLILCETAVIIVTLRLIRLLAPAANARALVILGIALNPAAILLICQHGNFDVIMVLWVLLAIAGLMRYNTSGNLTDWLCACLFLGLGILTKTVPLALVPLLAGGFRRATASGKLLGAALVLGPVTLGMSIIYVLSPAEVAQNVLGYRANGFLYGFEGILRMMGCENFSGYARLAFYLLGMGIMALTWHHLWTGHALGNRELALYTALALLAISGDGSGFVVQYFYWFLPFLILTWAGYPGVWRKLLLAFGIVSAFTFILLYGLVPAYGSNFLFVLSHAATLNDLNDAVQKSHDPLFLRVAGWSDLFSLSNTETLADIPMFIAGLVLLVFGARLLLNTVAGLPKRWVLGLAGFYALCIFLIFAIADIAANGHR